MRTIRYGRGYYGVRFRKSIKVGKNTRINLSKSGIGISSGVKGARVSVNSRGTRTTLSVPGTGLSYVTHKSHGSSKRNNEVSQVQYVNSVVRFPKGKYYSKPIIIADIVLSLLLMMASVGIGLVFLGFGIYFLVKSETDANKAYKFYNKALKTKDESEKVELLKTAKEIDNENTLVNYHLAHTAFENGDSKKTLEYINNMKDYKGIDPNELARIYTISLFETENYQEVINFLEDKIDVDLSSKLTVALAYKGLGQVKKASEILSTGPVNKRTYDDVVLMFKYELGLCYLELGEKGKAKRQLQKVYEVDSSFRDIVEYARELGFAVGEHLN